MPPPPRGMTLTGALAFLSWILCGYLMTIGLHHLSEYNPHRLVMKITYCSVIYDVNACYNWNDHFPTWVITELFR